MDRARRLASCIALLVALTAWSRLASAQLTEAEKAAIRSLANDAAADYEAARYEQAREKFQRAYDAAPVPKLAVWLARTDIQLGRFVSARALYEEAQRLERNELWKGDTQQAAQRDAEQELAGLEPRIPRVLVRVEAPGLEAFTLELDGVAVPTSPNGAELMVDPGTHRITARAGEQVTQRDVNVTEGERRELLLSFAAPRAAAAPAAQASTTVVDEKSTPTPFTRSLGWIGLSVGAAGLIVGTTAGVVVAMQHDELSDACPNDECEPGEWSRVDGYRTWRTVSTVGLAVGAIGAAAGVTLLLMSTERGSEPALALTLGPASATLKGRF